MTEHRDKLAKLEDELEKKEYSLEETLALIAKLDLSQFLSTDIPPDTTENFKSIIEVLVEKIRVAHRNNLIRWGRDIETLSRRLPAHMSDLRNTVEDIGIALLRAEEQDINFYCRQATNSNRSVSGAPIYSEEDLEETYKKGRQEGYEAAVKVSAPSLAYRLD